MPLTVSHVLSMTTPDNTNYENKPSDWNKTHAITFTPAGSEISAVFSNANGISFGLSNTAITASYTQLNQAFSADASSTFQTLTFQNSNGVSFSNNAGALRVTHDLQFTSATSAITSNALHSSASRVINIIGATNNTGGGTASLSSNVSFSAANGITFYTSAGNAIVGSVVTSYRASNDAVGLNTALTAGPLAWTVNSSGISLNAGSAAGTTSGFSGNLISGSMTHNTAGLALSLNHPSWLTTARGSTDAIGLNTAKTNVTWTVNSSGLSFDAGGYAGTGTSATNASITLNSVGLAISVAAGGGINPVASASNGSFSFTTLNFSNANNVTFGTSAGSIITASVAAPGAAAENNWVNLLGANTAGNTTASGSTIGFSGINLTLSGTNGSVVNISGPATSSLVGTSGISISTNGSTISVIGAMGSYFQNIPFYWSAIQSTSFVQSTSMVQPLEIPEVLSIGRMRFLRSVLAGATSVATVANTSWGFTQNHTHNFVFYTRGTGASSLSLMSYTSTSFGLSMTIQGSNGAASNNLSVFRSISAPISNGLSQFTFSTAPAGSASVPFATTDCSNFISGLRLYDSQFNASFNPGLHYLVHGISTTGTTGGATAASALTACAINFGALMIIGVNSNIASFGTSAQSFNHALAGVAGSFTTAGGGTTDNIGSISNFTSIASNPVIYFMMDRIA